MKKSQQPFLTLVTVLFALLTLCVGCRHANAGTTIQVPKDLTVLPSRPDLLIVVATNSPSITTVDYSIRIRISEKDQNALEKKLEAIEGVLSANIFDKGHEISIRRSPAFTKDEVERNVVDALMDYFLAKEVVVFDSSTDTRMNIENQINFSTRKVPLAHKMIIH